MHTATVRITFDAAHRVLGHTGKCRHIHGHSYVAEVTFKPLAGLSELGFVADFSVLKKIVKDFIDGNWDHNIILNEHDALATGFREGFSAHGFTLDVFNGKDPYLMSCGNNPTAECMAEELFDAINDWVARTDIQATVCEVKIQETENSWATYKEDV